MDRKYTAAGVICFLISFLLSRAAVQCLALEWTTTGIIAVFIIGVLIIASFLLGVIYLFISTRRVSKYHTLFSALACFMFKYYLFYIGKRRLVELRRGCVDSRSTQEDRLQLIMSKNKNTDYGRKFNLKDIHSLKDFQSKHPLTQYDHYKQFIQRVAKGEKNVMTVEPVTRLVLTSGTTGLGKQIPQDINQMYNAHAITLRIQSEFFSNFQPLNKEFRIHCNSKIRESEAGITIAAGAAVDRRIKSLLIAYSTPPDGFLIENIQDAFYVHFLFALRERELGSTFAIFTSIIVDGFKYLEQHWPEMVEDIANGTINATLTLPASIREELTKAMGEGDAERAAEVKRECERGQDGIMRRLWPTMQSITAIDNIGLRETLMQTVAKGIRVYSMLYGSSEALIGFNLNPIKEGYEEFVLNIRDVIFEFINEGDVYEDNPKTFLIDEVEIGKKYELVISQLWGLYRYRFGDVIQVTGFYQNCPKVKFLYRTATLLNLFGEKVDQVVITGSLAAALGNWQGVTLKHYSVTESTMVSTARANTDDKSKGAHYVFFLEMEGNDEDTSVRNIDTDKLSEQIDENIYNRHEFFRTFRDTNQISSCKVYLVKSNTFGKLKSFVLANTTASEVQFKMPKKLRTKEMTVLMLDNLL
ncbi:uncharacterized protein [Apostichopus japonicus]|uniref:uncharacterized protein isoform X1 n=2 Tax=Stichopus japonicus TaxID=307972 RepID=UPI003AB3ECF3